MTKRSWGRGLLLVGFGAPTFHFFISSTSYFLVVKKMSGNLGVRNFHSSPIWSLQR